MWYPKRTMRKECRTADELIQESEKPSVTPGSKGKALADLRTYMKNPDKPMVPRGTSINSLASTDNMNIAPSKLYEDGGHKLNWLKALAERGTISRLSDTREGILTSCEEYLTFCGDNKIPPTIAAFALWNGISLSRLNQIERGENQDVSDAIAYCKDVIRTFLELSAMDSTLNPIIYFHQQKVYYGAVENQQVNVHIESNSSDLTPDEYRARTQLLLNEEVIDCD